ncbi:MAG: hypothetical protein NXI20_02315 [bacterium]|nr:hypothetical protein [bacterium]
MICNILLSYVLIVAHPFHISVTEIEFDQDAKAIEIAQKIFIDDLGEVIKDKDGQEYNLFQAPGNEEATTAIKEYVMANFEVIINEKPKDINFLGIQVEEDVMWCFMEIENVKKLKNIKVNSSILTELFDDQMNLIHVKAFGETKSMRLHINELSDQIYY